MNDFFERFSLSDNQKIKTSEGIKIAIIQLSLQNFQIWQSSKRRLGNSFQKIAMN